MSKRTRRRKTGSAGLWLLEAVAMLGFISLLILARNERDAASAAPRMTANEPAWAGQTEDAATGWQQHRPRFTQVMADIWNAAF